MTAKALEPNGRSWKPVRPWQLLVIGLLMLAVSLPSVYLRPDAQTADFVYSHTLYYLLFGLAAAMLYQEDRQSRLPSFAIFALATVQILLYAILAKADFWQYIAVAVIFWAAALSIELVFRKEHGLYASLGLLAAVLFVMTFLFFGGGVPDRVRYALPYAVCFFAVAAVTGCVTGTGKGDGKKVPAVLLVCFVAFGLAVLIWGLTQDDFLYVENAVGSSGGSGASSLYAQLNDNNLMRGGLLALGVAGTVLGLFRLRAGVALTALSYLYYGFGALFEKFFAYRAQSDYSIYASPWRYIVAAVVLVCAVVLILPFVRRQKGPEPEHSHGA